MSGDDFVDRFFASQPDQRFGHREHLLLAWSALERYDLTEATGVVGTAIRRFAEAHGAGRKYHRTITEFWVRLVDHCRRTRPDIADFDGFLEAFPMLLDPGLAGRHWSDEALWSDEARAAWREPDLGPLPA
jgi:hypothetical protein